ncbi:VIT domain-containing protein [Nannocystis sp. RBIL2]|uniref:VIT domain-containing protein n=1 Tax=Nannocystis sp. RBIL2 TaxID=2996788 RepID=UPI00226EA00E|nr:VIT domain-containing protein [Nannocystis sp. RBIL2]MCY1065384.1 VIT domain-containing protein [Nannocystis sp. RBIL2]
MQRTALLLAVLATLSPAPAAADRLASARGQPLTEVSHEATVRIEDGIARYRVRRTFANAGTQAEEAALRIDLAHGAAVTGLRIRARDRWYSGELMEAEEALAKYRELTGIGASEAKDPALLQWVWADSAHLRVFPVLAGTVHTVEYTLTAPLEYRDGRYVITYPRPDASTEGTLPLAAPILRVDPGHGDARTVVRVAGNRVAPDAAVVLAPPPKLEWVGDGAPDPGAGYVFSRLDIERDEPVLAAEVDLEIDHTFSGDLQVHLVTPAGEHVEVTRGASGSNDIRGAFKLDLPAPQAKSPKDPVPKGMSSLGAWHLVVSDHAGFDVGSLDAWSLTLTPAKAGAAPIRAAAVDLPRFIPDAPDGDGDGDHVVIEVEPPPLATLAARLGRVVASAERGFTRLEIDAAPRLRELPRRASVVFVLDVSRSVPEAETAAQLRIVDAYLSHVPDASVELVVFDRTARRAFGQFVAAKDIAAALAKARAAGTLTGGNGSALEEGLGLAATVLQGRHGPTRIVALTDALLRSRFRNALADPALARAPGATVTHLVIPEQDSEAWIRRDDAHDLAPIVDGHRGVLFAVSAPEGDKALAKTVLGLVRPIAIDHFAIRGVDLSEAQAVPETLREGAGYRAMIAAKDPTRSVVITGKIWATPFRRVVRHEPGFDAATAAFVFSEDEHDELTKEEMLRVAFAGRAVSPVTSYLATEPGVRPSTEGLLDEEIGESLGLAGLGLAGAGAGGGGSGAAPLPSFESLLAPAVDRCVAAHKPASGWKVELELETTGVEIVDVQATSPHGKGMGECLVEAAWQLVLPNGDWPSRETHKVSLG